MKTYKIGDKITFTKDTTGFPGHPSCSNIGKTGVIVEIDNDDDVLPIRILAQDGYDFWYGIDGIKPTN